MTTERTPNRLRTERLARGWSQEQLGAAAGIAQPNISEYETGAAFPMPETIDRLAAVFEVGSEVVFRWLREPASEVAA